MCHMQGQERRLLTGLAEMATTAVGRIFFPPDLFRMLVNSLPQVGLKTGCQTEDYVAGGGGVNSLVPSLWHQDRLRVNCIFM